MSDVETIDCDDVVVEIVEAFEAVRPGAVYPEIIDEGEQVTGLLAKIAIQLECGVILEGASTDILTDQPGNGGGDDDANPDPENDEGGNEPSSDSADGAPQIDVSDD